MVRCNSDKNLRYRKKKKPLLREQRWVEEKGEGVPGFGHGEMGIRTIMTKRVLFFLLYSDYTHQ